MLRALAKPLLVLCAASVLWLAAVVFAPAAATGFTHILLPGRYKIDVLVEDPRTGRQQSVQQVERCFAAGAIAGHTIFEMMSDTPASGCPKYEICAGQDRTGFMAQCSAGQVSSAVGMFALEPDHFRGRIEVKDQNDKLLNVELQFGDRVGDCEPAEAAKQN